MEMTMIDDYANRLYSAHGDKAEYEAAQKARNAVAEGKEDEAEQWRRVRDRIHILRGPNVS